METMQFNYMPLYVAGLALVYELGSRTWWPVSGAISAGLATATVLAFRGELVVVPTTTITEIPKEIEHVLEEVETFKTPNGFRRRLSWFRF